MSTNTETYHRPSKRQSSTDMNQSSVLGKIFQSAPKEDDKTTQQNIIESLETDLRRAHETIEQLRETNSRLREEWRQATNELLSSRGDHSNYKVDDRTIRGLYEQLIAKIEDWVGFNCTSNVEQPKDTDLMLLRALTPIAEVYLQSNELKPLLFRSYLMWLVYQRVLCDSSDSGLLWAGSVRQDFRNMIDKLKPGMSHLIWHILSAALILRRQLQDCLRTATKQCSAVWNYSKLQRMERENCRITSNPRTGG